MSLTLLQYNKISNKINYSFVVKIYVILDFSLRLDCKRVNI